MMYLCVILFVDRIRMFADSDSDIWAYTFLFDLLSMMIAVDYSISIFMMYM